jgi:hypothetical protein
VNAEVVAPGVHAPKEKTKAVTRKCRTTRRYIFTCT